MRKNSIANSRRFWHNQRFGPQNMYAKPLEKYDYGELMSVADFKQACKQNVFIDYDGSGFLVKDKMVNDKKFIFPSKLNEIPDDATHIIWFNK